MSQYKNDRNERRELKQKLFFIRRYMEGEYLKLNAELKDLKAQYEALEGFTSWSDFPERWDIGDPNKVKANSYAFSAVDTLNVQKICGKSYDTIVHLEQKAKSKQEIEAMAVLESKLKKKVEFVKPK